MYHYFGHPPGADPERLFVDRETFAAQLGHLRRTGWRALSLDEYLAALDGAPTPARSYLVTIDDGHESVCRIAAPLLAEFGVPSVLFVCPGLLGDRARWTPPYSGEQLSPPEELRSLPALGMELGVHSWDHTRMVGMDDAALETHARRSRDALEAATGVSARAFAYPYGTHDLAARTAVAAAGYDVAFAVAREHGRFAVDRVFVQSTDSPLEFRMKLSDGYRMASRVGGRAWKLRHRARAVAARVRPGNAARGTDDNQSADTGLGRRSRTSQGC
jgi:peptidoglycan/xylan/chitin deacetylase (PgdA/CDA1 family)